MTVRASNSYPATIAAVVLSTALIACGGSSNSDNGAAPGGTTDSDNDGVPDTTDAFPNNPAETVDTDGDGIGDNEDTDDDADGVPDDMDEYPLDTDNDTLPNDQDDDDDDDGVLDVDDAFPLDQSESADSDNDGIGDNADTDNTMGQNGSDPGSVITMGGSTCINSGDGNGTFAGGWTWSDTDAAAEDLSVTYNITDNTTGCAGLSGSLPGLPAMDYTMSWQVPVSGESIANIVVTVNNATGLPVVVQNYTNTNVNISSPDSDVGGAGSWDVDGCSLTITSVENASATNLLIVEGSIFCDSAATPPQILTRPLPNPGFSNTQIVFDAPITFRTVVGTLI